MRTFLTAGVALVVVVAATLVGHAQQQPNISGTWSFSVDVGGTHGDPTFVFAQKGQQLAGTVTNGVGTQKVVGAIKRDKAVFGFQGVRDGRPLKASYEGTVTSPAKMTGRVEFTGALSGTGTWTAIRR